MQQEVRKVKENNRAEYFRERRDKFKAFHVEVDKKTMERFEEKLKEKKQTKKKWLDEKISEELKK